MSTAEKPRGYSIKEMAEITGLSQDTLRFYEKEGIISPVTRLPNGHRSYQEYDRNWLDFILCLRSTGMSYSEILRYKDLMEEGDDTLLQRREILITHRENLLKSMEEQQKALEAINWKIEHYYKLEDHL